MQVVFPMAGSPRPYQERQLLELGVAEEHLVGDVIALKDIGVLKERLIGKGEVNLENLRTTF